MTGCCSGGIRSITSKTKIEQHFPVIYVLFVSPDSCRVNVSLTKLKPVVGTPLHGVAATPLDAGGAS